LFRRAALSRRAPGWVVTTWAEVLDSGRRGE
jgi:hypothetical protein